MLMFFGFAFGIFTLLISVIFNLIMTIKRSFNTAKFDLEWYVYIDIAVVGLCSASCILWCLIFLIDR